MGIQAVVFDSGGVLLFATGSGEWLQPLGLSEEEYLQRLLTSGVIPGKRRIAANSVPLWHVSCTPQRP
jgi:hypothetical protein